MKFMKRKPIHITTPKGGYRPPKPSGWGMLAGVFAALVLGVLLLIGGASYVSSNIHYYEPHVQFEYQRYDEGRTHLEMRHF